MRNNDCLSLLLIESDEISRGILLNNIKLRLPYIELNSSATLLEALQLLEEKEHDIVICDTLLASDERVRFMWQMCAESEPIVIVITADTDIKLESFPSIIKDVCVQHVAYKPVDLCDLMRNIEHAIERVKARKSSKSV